MKQTNKQKTTKPSIKVSGEMKKQELLKPNFSQLLSCKTLKIPNYNFECLFWRKKNHPQVQDPAFQVG